MSDIVVCPKCESEFTYEQDGKMVCSQCFNEFTPGETAEEDKILDAHGHELQNGDTVVVINGKLSASLPEFDELVEKSTKQ